MRLVALVAAVGLAAWGAAEGRARLAFDHDAHLRLFPGGCTTCHAGAAEAGASLWPTVASCAACHDGTVEERVEWSAPTPAPRGNLRFAHATHRSETGDSVRCGQCHQVEGRLSPVHRTDAGQCIDCHEPGKGHLEAPDRACATCHVPLAEATALTPAEIAAFEAPPSHRKPGFGLEAHGELAATTGGVAASCATCHAREFCLACHVNAPEVAAIQALAHDERSTLLEATFAAPPSHATDDFAERHGRAAKASDARCANCHTERSCTACHAGPVPRAVAAMPEPGPGRAAGAVVARTPPVTHTTAFTEDHGDLANASPTTCSTCHRRDQCLTCHRGDGSSTGGSYHPANFLSRHPSAAYNRQVSCGDCHNVQQFCASCHATAGLGARNTLTAGPWHDAKGAFLVGHGPAARQSLESCVSCHVERDCTSCHSAVGGRRFNPHGPGFDADRLRRRNPEMCIACHGAAIPGR